MKKTLLLDGYNVIHLIPSLEILLNKSLEASREGLIQYAKNYQQKRGDLAKILIVFDGKQGNWDLMNLVPQRSGGVEVLFTEGGQSADDKILEILEDTPKPDSFMVVSNDNYIINNAKAYGVTPLSVQAFRASVEKNSSQSVGGETGIGKKSAQSITDEYKTYLGIKD
jgi:predicted RNA-binding protein with PIN domain